MVRQGRFSTCPPGDHTPGWGAALTRTEEGGDSAWDVVERDGGSEGNTSAEAERSREQGNEFQAAG